MEESDLPEGRLLPLHRGCPHDQRHYDIRPGDIDILRREFGNDFVPDIVDILNLTSFDQYRMSPCILLSAVNVPPKVTLPERRKAVHRSLGDSGGCGSALRTILPIFNALLTRGRCLMPSQ